MTSTLSSLLSHDSPEDHEAFLKAANETLKKSKGDRQAQHVRAVALLKLERYEDALRAFEAGDDLVKEGAPLAYAYALYKNGRIEDSQEASSGTRATRGLRHMQAQASYRLEKFIKARELYTGLDESAGVEEGDLRINAGATDAQLTWSGYGYLAVKTHAEREDMQQFDMAFNAACGYIARGELKQAATLLARAKGESILREGFNDLCNATDELTADEKHAELLPILVQQVYVLSKLGKTEEAADVVSNIEVFDISDNATRHIAQTNELVLSTGAKNPYIAHRVFNLTSRMANQNRPFRFQSAILRRDGFGLGLQVGKGPTSAISTASKQSPSNISQESATVGVFRAASKARSQTGNLAIREIMPLLEKHPEDIGLLLTIVHLYMLTNNTHVAATLLGRFFAHLEQSSSTEAQDVRFAPGLIALQASLDAKLNRGTHTKQELAKAASYWRHREKSRAEVIVNVRSLLAAAGLALLDTPTPQQQTGAREIFEHISKEDPKSRGAIAGLAATSQQTDDLRSLNSMLPSVTELTAGIDASALEDTGVAKASGPLASLPSQKRPASDVAINQSKTKKIRQSRTPKNFDPNKKMDPERWLPLRDRSKYRPRGKKKGKAAQGMATQGGLVSDDSRPSTPSQVLQQPGKPGVGGKGKKKGKR